MEFKKSKHSNARDEKYEDANNAEPDIFRFDHDHWSLALVHDLETGDVVYHQGQLIEVIDNPYEKEGWYHVPVRIPEPKPIILAFGQPWEGKRYIGMSMDYVRAGLTKFEDGTALICELQDGPGAIYSPRLPILDLEEFCKSNIDKYEAFFESNEERLEKGVIVPMEQWWKE